MKVRFAQHQEFVVGGYKPSATNFDSLLVGYYDKTKLLAPARCAAASRRTCARRCSSSYSALETTRCPFANLPSTRSGHWGEGITADEMKALIWVKPKQVVEVSFAEWTRDGSLRHASFLGLREDKRARDVHRE